ncbi:MAG: gamma-glutamyltransferase family protein, partial [Bdellovibrionota bacterium]
MRFHLLPLLVLVSLTAFSAEPPVWDGTAQSSLKSRVRPTVGTKGMVVSDDRVASEWGAEILRQGGNAVDAAVATAFALSVTRPHFASIGGGGFLVYCPKPGSDGAKPCEALDYREIAPEKASRDMYIKDGKPRTDLSQDGALASGVPGVTAGLLQALEKWGTLSRDKLLARPIELARGGVAFTGLMEGVAQERWKAMNAEARRIFSCGSSAESPEAPCAAGTTLKQPDLAKTLQAISEKGVKGFYEGGVAQAIVDSLQAEGGILTLKDLKTYKPVLRKPVEGDAFGMHFVSMPPPSSGGAIVLQLLAYASRADKQGLLNEGYGSPKTLHALAHGMALAFADRAKFFGDPDRVEVPLVKLLSPEYLDARWKTFQPDKAAIPEGAGELVIPGTSPSPSPNSSGVPDSHTTHFSVIDKDGNAVAVTPTINDEFGSGCVPMGTGVVMT